MLQMFKYVHIREQEHLYKNEYVPEDVQKDNRQLLTTVWERDYRDNRAGVQTADLRTITYTPVYTS